MPFQILAPRLDLNCNFENGLCNWHQGKLDDGDWRLHSGSTSTSNTGPTVDHTIGNGKDITK